VVDAVAAIESPKSAESLMAAVATLMLLRTSLAKRYLKYDESAVSRFLERSNSQLDSLVSVRDLTEALNEFGSPSRVFDTSAWRRAPNPAGVDFGAFDL
jgi:hypothetical protein